MVAEVDGRVTYAGEILAWLNHLFEERYTNVRSKSLWKIYKLLPDYARDQELFDIVVPGQENCLSTFGYLNYICIADLEFFDKGVAEVEKTEPSGGKFNPVDTIQRLRCVLKTIKEQTTAPEAELRYLKELIMLRSLKDVEFPDNNYLVFAFCAILISYEMVLFFVAKTFKLDFWQLLEEMEPLVADKKPALEDEGEPFPAIPPEDTAEFLHCSDDDRAFFWTADGDVEFSDEMQEWMAGLKEELEEILAAEGNIIEPADFFMVFLRTLEKVNETYRRVYAFSSMFQEFIGKAGQREYQAAVILLQRLLKRYEGEAETLKNAHWSYELDLPGRQNMKRYLAILANVELRQHVFGF